MKYKSYLLLSLFLFSSLAVWAQSATYKQPVPERVVPKIILATFYKQYPDASVRTWLTTHISYWYSDYDPLWYNGWYGPRQVVVYTYSEPAYYEVVFEANPAEVSRAIYNRYGFWYETRTQLRGLPIPVMEGFKKTKYKDWKMATHKERLEIPGNPGPIYRFKVSKGVVSKIIRLDGNGNIIQEKQLQDPLYND